MASRVSGDEQGARPLFLDRGEKTTRIEAFLDAAFAFALTLLVIAGDHIPASVPALLQALKSVPAYALSFLLILKFWSGHVAWSRAYGLDDDSTRRLSLMLVFLVLVFVYPMRMVLESLCNSVSGGILPATFSATRTDFPALFVAFSLGFGCLSAVMLLLYRHAWGLRSGLGLSAVEIIQTQAQLRSWTLCVMVAAVSLASALLIPARVASGWWIGFPGFIYFSLNIINPLLHRHGRRQVALMTLRDSATEAVAPRLPPAPAARTVERARIA